MTYYWGTKWVSILSTVCAVHTHLSRLCFFPLFFFFSLRVGEELPNLSMRGKQRSCFHCRMRKAKIWLFTCLCVTFLCTRRGSLLAKVSFFSGSALFVSGSIHLLPFFLSSLLYQYTFPFVFISLLSFSPSSKWKTRLLFANDPPQIFPLLSQL